MRLDVYDIYVCICLFTSAILPPIFCMALGGSVVKGLMARFIVCELFCNFL